MNPYQTLLDAALETPALYAPGTAPFWDDGHISEQMLKAHLDPDHEAASRKHAFIRESVRWIAGLFSPASGKALIDLGCGPGLYAEGLCRAGFRVTGVDLSPRSVAYARASAEGQGLDIRYVCGSYLELSEANAFDVATLIYCDFGALSPEKRRRLLLRVRRALRPGGALLLDAHAPRELEGYVEGTEVQAEGAGGFWSASPYLCLKTRRLYPRTENMLDRYVVVTAEQMQIYNIWNQIYRPETLEAELRAAGFGEFRLFGDVAGAPWTEESKTLCVVAR